MKRAVLLTTAGAALAAVVVWRGGVGSAEPLVPFRLDPLASPAAAGSASPQLTSDGHHVTLSWIEPEAASLAVKYADRSRDGWSQPRVVASGDRILVNVADVPSVRRLDDTTLAAHWLERQSSGSAGYDLWLRWSRDAGRTWSDPIRPYADRSDAEHGFASLFAAPDRGVGVVWLDGRDLAVSSHGATALRAASFAPDGSGDGDIVVDDRACDCCPTSATVTADGVIVAYRDRDRNDVRDISVSRLAGGAWGAPATVHVDGWITTACPVNGPSISARGRTVVVAWFTGREGRGHGFVAFSTDGGVTFERPISIDDESPVGRVQAALLEDGTAAVAWISYPGGGSELRLRRIAPDGARSPLAVAATRMGTQAPRLAAAGGELVIAWTEAAEAGSHVRTARAAVGGPAVAVE